MMTHACSTASATAGALPRETAFGVYEVALMAAALVLGSGDVFAPAMVGRLALIDAAWLGGLVLVHVVLAAWRPPWRGVTSRLARVS